MPAFDGKPISAEDFENGDFEKIAKAFNDQQDFIKQTIGENVEVFKVDRRKVTVRAAELPLEYAFSSKPAIVLLGEVLIKNNSGTTATLSDVGVLHWVFETGKVKILDLPCVATNDDYSVEIVTLY